MKLEDHPTVKAYQAQQVTAANHPDVIASNMIKSEDQESI